MNFGMDGPSVTGWWYNPQTGDKFNAIDTYFEDNNLLIKTADNRLLNFNQIQNYLHVEDEKSIPNITPQKQKNQTTDDDLPPEVKAILEEPGSNGAESLIIPDDDIYGGTRKLAPAAELGNIYKEAEPETQAPTKSTDFDIIDRALANKSYPTIETDVWWDTYPQREIEMLIDVLNIPEEKIVQYYINNISIDDIINTVKDSIREYIIANLHPVIASSGIETNTQEVSDKQTTKKSKQNKSNK